MYTKQYLSEREAAIYLSVNQQTIARLRKKGLIRAVKLNRSWIYKINDIDQFFETYLDCDLSGQTKIERKL